MGRGLPARLMAGEPASGGADPQDSGFLRKGDLRRAEGASMIKGVTQNVFILIREIKDVNGVDHVFKQRECCI
jgi:hypothetical protein